MSAKGRFSVWKRFLWFGVIFLAVLLAGPASCKKRPPESRAKAGAETAAAVEKEQPTEKTKVEKKALVPEKEKPRERQPSSLDLVEKAEQEGLLDLDTAWTYKFQAMFEPGALPEKYRGRGRIPCGTSVFSDFLNVKGRLTPETLAKLKPYLVRPTDPESIYAERVMARLKKKETEAAAPAPETPGFGLLFAGEQQVRRSRPDKDTYPGLFCTKEIGRIKVWVPLDCEFAKVIADMIDRYRMWERYAELLGRAPPSDGAETDNGGDDKLDIYLMPESLWTEDREDPGTYVCGYCQSTKPIVDDPKENLTSPAYIVINAVQFGQGAVEASIAHELFHAFQFAFDRNEENWWLEGTATWAENFIDPGWDTEHEYDDLAFDKTQHRLLPITSTQGLHEYAIYLFPFTLAKVYDEWIIRQIWEKCPASTATKAVREVMDSADKEGFKGVFKTFAYMNWSQNQDPKAVKYPEEVKPQEYHDYEYHNDLPLPAPFAKSVDLPGLSAVYYLFWNTSEKEVNFPHLTFDLKDFAAAPELNVQAFIQYRNKDPKYEDWTGRDEVEFCLNDPEQDFEWVALTLGNSASLLGMTPQLRVWQSSSGCGEGETIATLTVTKHYTTDADSSNAADRRIETTAVEQELEASISLILDYDKSTYSRAQKRIQEHWKVRDWKINSSHGWMKKSDFLENPSTRSNGQY